MLFPVLLASQENLAELTSSFMFGKIYRTFLCDVRMT